MFFFAERSGFNRIFEMEIHDEDSITDPDWSKMASKASNAGFKEGIISAKDSMFQQGFDDGFKTGFKTGFALGMFHGVHKSSSSEQISKTNELKNLALKGNCQICVNNDLLQLDSVKEVRDIQIKASEQKIADTRGEYADIMQKLGSLVQIDF